MFKIQHKDSGLQFDVYGVTVVGNNHFNTGFCVHVPRGFYYHEGALYSEDHTVLELGGMEVPKISGFILVKATEFDPVPTVEKI